MRGKLAFADIDETADLAVWLDAVYAAFADAPRQVLADLNKEMVIKGALIDPDEARKTWGTRPEHAAMAGGLGRGPGLEAGGAAGKAPEARMVLPSGRPGSPRKTGR